MSNREVDDIFSHPDLQPAVDGYDDVQTLELMTDVKGVNELQATTPLRQDDLEFVVDALHNGWRVYVNKLVYVAGTLFAHHEGRVVPLVADTQTYGYFRGFTTELIAGESELPKPELCYAFSNLEEPNDTEQEILFFARSDVHLEFPELLSERRAKALSEPILTEVDEIIVASADKPVGEIIAALVDADISTDASHKDLPFVYAMLVRHLDKMFTVSDIRAITTNVRGLTYSVKTRLPIEADGKVALAEPRFTVFTDAKTPVTLCLRGIFSARNQMLVGEERLVPIAHISDIGVLYGSGETAIQT